MEAYPKDQRLFIFLISIGFIVEADARSTSPPPCERYYFWDSGLDLCEPCQTYCREHEYTGVTEQCEKLCPEYMQQLRESEAKIHITDPSSSAWFSRKEVLIPVAAAVAVAVVLLAVIVFLRCRKSGRFGAANSNPGQYKKAPQQDAKFPHMACDDSTGENKLAPGGWGSRTAVNITA